MTGHLTLALIKPHIVRERKVGQIINMIEEAEFGILLAKNLMLRPEGIHEFYKEHIGKEFFNNILMTMSAGPLWALVLGKPNAVEEWRNLIGSTHPAEAAPGTIRNLFGYHTNTEYNAVHGSDSDEAALREISFFFSWEISLALKTEEFDKEPKIEGK